jgi:hypothetical protein
VERGEGGREERVDEREEEGGEKKRFERRRREAEHKRGWVMKLGGGRPQDGWLRSRVGSWSGNLEDLEADDACRLLPTLLPATCI